MDFISKLEKRFGSWAIPNLTLYLLVIQIIGVVLMLSGRINPGDLLLLGSDVIQEGEWWRLLSFMMLPKTLSVFWLFFVFYIFYLVGNSLEQHWGTFRFNLYVLTGYLLTVSMAFMSPGAVITNLYFLGSIFLAFATLFPNIEFRLFFVLPVKVKWLGWLTAAAYILTLLSSLNVESAWARGDRLCIVAAFANYLLFFSRDFARGLQAGQRRKSFAAENRRVDAAAIHECAECGITDKSDETMHFRYCSTCGKCFCEEHINHHEH